MPEMLSLSIKNINVFWERIPDPPIQFHTNHLRAGVMENKVKLGRAKLSKEIRVGEPNILCGLKCKFKVVIY